MGQKIIIKLCALVSGMSGLIILFSTIYPILAYEWESSLKYPMLLSPIPDQESGKYALPDASRDFTKASNWFEGTKKEEFVSNNVSYFTLSVSRLKIDNASVAIGGEDLSQSLIQYPGTALPGKPGNSVIFGHSILPIFYDPKNYMAIFSTLDRLKKGDELFAYYDGITFKYKVENMFEVRPADIQILEQDTSGSFLTLVTCTPPGDPRKPKRLIVRARLIPYTQANADTGN